MAGSSSPESMARPDRRRIQARQLKIGGRVTSLKLERPYWDALDRISRREQLTVGEIICSIDLARSQGLTASVRVFAVSYLLAGEKPDIATIIASLGNGR